jgi:hypothetical protein
MKNPNIEKRIKKMVLWMLEINPEKRPNFEQIKKLKIPFSQYFRTIQM